MVNKKRTFTSTGSKLIHHPDVVGKFHHLKLLSPISLQIAPTSRCNLNCVFCSNANREKHEDLSEGGLLGLLTAMKDLGAKTVEWTGGGDPTLYHHINEFIQICDFMKYKQGFITNGLLLRERLEEKSLGMLHWIRISMNCLDYVEKVDIPKEKLNGVLGFSYVMNERTNEGSLSCLARHMEKYQPKYVRIITDCQATEEEQIENNKRYSKLVSGWGEPYFYQAKVFSRPERCWWCYVKPFVLHDGWVYPCSSVVLNEGTNYTFHSDFRWVRMEDLPGLYKKEAAFFPTEKCSHCVFRNQNDDLDSVINPTGMEDFV